MNDKTRKRIWLIVIAVVVIAALVALYFYLDSKGYMEIFKSIEALQAYVGNFGAWAPAIFMLLQVAQVIFAPIPGNVTTLAGGAMFGFWPAMIYSIIAIFVGSMIAFALGKLFGRTIIDKLAPKEIVDKYIHIVGKKQRMTLTMMFLLPFFPDDVLCLLAGLAGYSYGYFAVMVLLTRPWGLIFSALIGSGALSMPIWGWAIIVVLSVALLYISVRYGSKIEDWLLAKIQKKNANSDNA